jgi:hypothetical protein
VLAAAAALKAQPRYPGLAPLLPAVQVRQQTPAGAPSLKRAEPCGASGVVGAAAADGAAAAKRAKTYREIQLEKAQTRAEKNRLSAANSRARQKQQVAEMVATINQLQDEVRQRDEVVASLRAENSTLRDQVEFFRGLLGESYRTTGSCSTAVQQEGVGHDGREGRAGAAVPVQGVVVMAVVLVCAFCFMPSWSSAGGVLSAGFSRIVPHGHAPSGRVLSSDITMTPVVPSVEAMPVPALLWSPSAAIALVLHAMGVQDAAQALLAHVIGLSTVAVVALVAGRWYRSSRKASKLPPHELPVDVSDE